MRRFSQSLNESKITSCFISHYRPSNDVIDGLDKQVKDMQAEMDSMKQKHQKELNELEQNAKTKEDEFEKEKSRY